MSTDAVTKAETGKDDQIRWLKLEIRALRQSVSLTRSLLSRMSSEDRSRAEQLITTNEKKIAGLTAAVGRYQKIRDDKIAS